uniref:glycine-rich protein n=1 Tax=Maribacter antarcticus TaxID=505250 RepID=UPI00047955D9
TNTCPITTIDLTTITASNDPANTILTWHTGLPATTINRVSDATAVAAGTYYAAFYNLTVDCYASNGDAVTQVIADGDSDCDGVLNGSDLDDDNDGILDTGENICTTNLYAGNVIEYTDNPIVGDNADDPTSALGASSAPNPPGSSGYVSLGGSAGDYLTLGFTNAYLSNSGDAQNDFRVFEIGSPETMGVRLRPDASTLALLNGSGQSFTIDGQGFYFVGQTQNVIDIDAAFGNAFAMGQLSFDAVKLFAVSNGSGGTAGPDINAIEALYFTCLIDTDNDGIPNSLDLDSDGDGCIDAIEGGSTFTYADLNNNQLAGGVDADGIPIVATASGQTIGSSQDLTVQDVICQCDAVTSGYLDTDSDGVSDICDLDDDNDGILDTEEGTTDLDNDGFPNSLDLDSDGDGCPDAIEGGGTFTITDLNNNQLTGGVDADGIPIVATASSQTIGSSQDLTVQDVICQCDLAFGNLDTDNDGIADVCDLDDDNDGILDTEEGTTDLDNDGFPNSLDLDSDGDGCPDAIEGGGTFTITDLNNNQLTGGVDADGIPIVATASGQTVGSSQDSSIVVCCDAVTSGYLDTDSDGVSDICDLDDDNDGILNTEECNPLINQVYSYTGGDQISIIPIGANLVRAKIWGAGGRGDQRNLRGTGGAGGYTEIEIPISALPGGTTQLIVTVGEGGNSSTGGPTYGNGGAGLIIASGRNCGSGGGMSALGLVSLSNPSSVNVNQIIAIAGGGGTMPAYSSGGSYAGEGGGTKGGDASSYPVNGGQGGSQTSGGLANTNGNIGSFLIGGDAVENGGAGGGGFYGGASGNISGNNEHGGGGGSGYISPSTSNGSTTTGNLQVPPNIADSDYTAGIGVGGNNGGGNGGNGLVILEYELALTCDIDNDGIPNSLDLDSDGDGCPDAIEGGFTDPDSDQILGNSPVVVDLNGLVIGQGGYTSPADLDANSVYDFKEPGAAPTITLQPLSQNVFSGADATFSLTETGADQYQWQESTDGGANYTGIIDGTEYAGALTSSLTILSIPLTKKGFMYRASITRTSFVCDQTLSNEITLTVSPRTVITNRWITNSVKKN